MAGLLLQDRGALAVAKPKPPPGERFEDDAWIEAVARGLEDYHEERGSPLVVTFPEPLRPAQARLMESLGVEVRTAPRGGRSA